MHISCMNNSWFCLDINKIWLYWSSLLVRISPTRADFTFGTRRSLRSPNQGKMVMEDSMALNSLLEIKLNKDAHSVQSLRSSYQIKWYLKQIIIQFLLEEYMVRNLTYGISYLYVHKFMEESSINCWWIDHA